METQNITIEEVTKFEDGLTEKLQELVVLLGEGDTPLSDTDVLSMIESPNTKLLVARQNGKIVGMVTLLLFRIPFTKKAILEDLVVSEAFQKHGIGKRLLDQAIAYARNEEASYADLTSRPSRVAANVFYERFGFEKRDTNVYRLKL